MDFTNLQQRAIEIRERYAQFEQNRYGRTWTREEIVLGFMGDVGDLAKLVIAAEGVRNIPDAEQKLAHELSDCLWSVIVLANLHGIDLETSFMQTMDQLEQWIQKNEVSG